MGGDPRPYVKSIQRSAGRLAYAVAWDLRDALLYLEQIDGHVRALREIIHDALPPDSENEI